MTQPLSLCDAVAESKRKPYREAAVNVEPLIGILGQAGSNEETKVVGPVTRWRQARRVVLTDVIEGAHYIHVEQWRLSLGYRHTNSNNMCCPL